MATKKRIFLAHASEDKAQVRDLYQRLKELGFDPWLDEVDLLPGQNWREEIPKAIKTAAVCLACLSKHSIEKKGYVQREFRHALSAYADVPPGSIYLIPVRLDECKLPDLQARSLELNFRDLHRVDLFEEGGFERLVAAIEGVLKTSTTELAPEPVPSSPDQTIGASDAHKKAQLNSANLEFEDRRNDWMVYEAAFLWHGFMPPSVADHWNLMTREISATKDMLHRAVDSGLLNAIETMSTTGGTRTALNRRVERTELRRFAQSISQEPEFLCPEVRATKDG